MQKKPDPKAQFGAFVDAIQKNKVTKLVFVGIDPGASGAIALVCGKHQVVVNIPKTVKAVKRVKKLSAAEQKATGRKSRTVDGTTSVFDLAGIVTLFRILNPIKHLLTVAVEEGQVQILGKGSNAYTGFRTGLAYGMWLLYLTSRGFPFYTFSPAKWKKVMNLSTDKELSRRCALKLYPDADIQRKKDHDRAEALLLANFLENNYQHYKPFLTNPD